ncbi:hypothetical protein GGR57DRAFT_459934 [Xylariaceae sp. FL1272]|nr:hypothetical protein GGR57DRAFT_459934 [Xylariaceae sp. FL1272]
MASSLSIFIFPPSLLRARVDVLYLRRNLYCIPSTMCLNHAIRRSEVCTSHWSYCRSVRVTTSYLWSYHRRCN